MRVAIVKAKRIDGIEANWLPLLNYLNKHGETIVQNKTDADTYIVLSGKYENPLCLRNGKRVLFYNTTEWIPKHSAIGWGFYSNLLKHYYDEMIDCTSLSIEEIYKLIKCYATANS